MVIRARYGHGHGSRHCSGWCSPYSEPRDIGFTGARLPDGRGKTRILRAVDRTREFFPCEPSCDSSSRRPVSSMPGARINRPVPAYRRLA
jgi:hypothetical protein